jgi:hypothetical protein
MGKKVGSTSTTPKATKAPKAKAAPVKAVAPAAKQPKISKPKVEEDLEVTEIKSLAQEPAMA